MPRLDGDVVQLRPDHRASPLLLLAANTSRFDSSNTPAPDAVTDMKNLRTIANAHLIALGRSRPDETASFSGSGRDRRMGKHPGGRAVAQAGAALLDAQPWTAGARTRCAAVRAPGARRRRDAIGRSFRAPCQINPPRRAPHAGGIRPAQRHRHRKRHRRPFDRRASGVAAVQPETLPDALSRHPAKSHRGISADPAIGTARWFDRLLRRARSRRQAAGRTVAGGAVSKFARRPVPGGSPSRRRPVAARPRRCGLGHDLYHSRGGGRDRGIVPAP